MSLLEIRKKMNQKRPAFKISSALNRKEVNSEKWRRPRGIHNKKRKRTHKGPMPQPGYKNPKEIRGTLYDGSPSTQVYTIEQLANRKTAILAHVGMKRRKELLEYAKSKSIGIVNLDIQKEIERINKKLSERQHKTKKEHTQTPTKTEEKQKPEDQKEKDIKQAEKIITKPQ
ncbi:hypothetical protein HY486_00380 [Candidatus Woesearchaeota archaeon]|nr:hypothetical protein [Candidatus Woesearchaeota archaeon]